MDIREAKRALRKTASECRSLAFQAEGPAAAERVAARFIDSFDIGPAEVVSGYCPVREEIDPLPLMQALSAGGIATALPVVVDRGRPLVFRAWSAGEALEAGAYGIPAPPGSALEVTPTLMLVPLLAFDGRGYRLGYGGGYYDITIRAYRHSSGPMPRIVGLAFAAQEVDTVPHDEYDTKLDWVVTGSAVFRCRGKD